MGTPPKGVERRLSAILNADAVAYSRRMVEDEVATVETLKRHRDIIARGVRANQGRVVDMAGDSLLAEFQSAIDAVRCALDVQEEIGRANDAPGSPHRLDFRIGVTVGDVIVEGDAIFGNGVNVAARVQALADAGGVALSGAAFDQVVGKLELHHEDLGDHRVKNIPGPVRIVQVRHPRETLQGDVSPRVPRHGVAAGFAERPAIAVLPFDNLSHDREQEYFADGIAEDLITRLACFRWCPVIARNSSFVYKGDDVDLGRVGSELGVHYVLRGSVRRESRRVRISVQFMDVTTGHQVWAERFERELADIFELQDEITISMLGALMPAMDRVERDRVMRQTPSDLNAWHCLQRGSWHLSQLDLEELRKAQVWFRKGAQLDPTFSALHSYLAVSHLYEIAYQWTDTPAKSFAACTAAAERAVALSDDDATAFTALGWTQAFSGDYERAIATEERAIALNPSYAAAYHGLGFPLSMSGRPREAIDKIERAIRLSPYDPLMYSFLGHIGQAYFQLGDHESATGCVRRSLELRPTPGLTLLLAASYALGDRLPEARETLAHFDKSYPDFSPETLRLFLPDFLVEMHLEGLRKVGWVG